MSLLTPTEQQIAKEIIEAGYANAAKSFSAIAQQEVTIKTSSLSVVGAENPITQLSSSEKLRLVTTKVVGDISGKSYFLLTQPESEAIFQACLPPSPPSPDRAIMEEAIIKEIDNIISAAVITEFSNVLNVSIYGDVPHLHLGTAEEIKLAVLSDFTDGSENDIYLFSNTHFSFVGNTTLQPQFFWKFPHDFVQRIKTHTQSLAS